MMEARTWDGRYLMFEETTLEPKNRMKVLQFGPLSATLAELYQDGWILRTYEYQTRKRTYPYSIKFYLSKGNLRYSLGKIRTEQFSVDNPPILSDIVRNGQQCAHVCSSVPVVADPWESLLAKYPKPTKKDPVMIGNQTLREYVVSQLSS